MVLNYSVSLETSCCRCILLSLAKNIILLIITKERLGIKAEYIVVAFYNVLNGSHILDGK